MVELALKPVKSKLASFEERSVMGSLKSIFNTVLALLTSPNSASSPPAAADTRPPTKAPTKTKIKMVPAIKKAREAPTNEEATFFRNDMKSGFMEAKVIEASASTRDF